ncbi:MAG: hypothetical protein KKB50_13285 [Planctomycetes bacterium]|nr:hypothetical protein [Planctomycetota bacterium]
MMSNSIARDTLGLSALLAVLPWGLVPALAQDDAEPAAKLKVGDKAPPLAVETWRKGDPVKGFEDGKVCVGA